MDEACNDIELTEKHETEEEEFDGIPKEAIKLLNLEQYYNKEE
jgi:hypothetical protein